MDFTEVIGNLSRMIEEKKIAGACAAVYHRGERVLETYQGFADLENGYPITPDSAFRLASMTKPVTAVAALLCREKGLLSLNDPVGRYLPGFRESFLARKTESGYERGDRNETPITVLQLLTHSSGLGSGAAGDFFYASVKPKAGDTLASAVERYSAVPLDFVPGTAQCYSPVMALDVVARIVEIVTKTPYSDFLSEAVFAPMKMEHTSYSLSAYRPENRVVSYRQEGDQLLREPLEHNFDDFPADYPGGGAGLLSTLGDYTRFARMLTDRGVSEGKRILTEESVELMRRPWLPLTLDGITDWYNWGLGVRTLSRTIPGQPLPPGSFGWSGAYGTHFWADPAGETAAVYLHNSLSYGGAGALHMYEFETGVVKAIGEAEA